MSAEGREALTLIRSDNLRKRALLKGTAYESPLDLIDFASGDLLAVPPTPKPPRDFMGSRAYQRLREVEGAILVIQRYIHVNMTVFLKEQQTLWEEFRALKASSTRAPRKPKK